MKLLIANVFYILFSVLCLNCRVSAHDSLIKIIVIDRNDSVWSEPINEIVMFIAGHDDYAPQTFEVKMSNSTCDHIGNIDMAKQPSDFVIVAKQDRTDLIKCDLEMGRINFAIISFESNATDYINGSFSGIIKFGSDESIAMNETEFTTPEEFLVLLKEKQTKISKNKIPLEYPFKTAREERVRRRMYLSIISLLFLSVVALLVLMFMNSLSRYNERKKKETKPKKKSNDAVIPEDQKEIIKEKSQRSERSEQSDKKGTKSSKSAKKINLATEKDPLLSKNVEEEHPKSYADAVKETSEKKKEDDKSTKSSDNDKDKSVSKENVEEKQDKSDKGGSVSKKTDEPMATKV